MFGQIYRSVMRRWVVLMPGWERLCSESNVGRKNARGTNGLGLPVETSQLMVELDVGTGWSCH